MPILHWLTRDEDLRAAVRAPYRLLEEAADLSAGESDAGNLLVQGDNLEALKALLPFYSGSVKCICIDPPYNTRSAFEHYDDSLEHARWLAMIGRWQDDPRRPCSRGRARRLDRERLADGAVAGPDQHHPAPDRGGAEGPPPSLPPGAGRGVPGGGCRCSTSPTSPVSARGSCGTTAASSSAPSRTLRVSNTEGRKVYAHNEEMEPHFSGVPATAPGLERLHGEGGEEMQCAQALDRLPGLKYWVRNVARHPDSFWLPTVAGRFYPDFVARLDDGRRLVVEYKGGLTAEGADTEEKRAVGTLWERTSGGKGLFVVVEKLVDGRDVRGQLMGKIGSSRMRYPTRNPRRRPEGGRG